MSNESSEWEVKEEGKTKYPEPNKNEIICPLIWETSGGAVNYEVTWRSETNRWCSSPTSSRSHSALFYEALQKGKDEGRYQWEGKCYYFSHEEGIEAREEYQNAVLDGKIKAHKKSWGPNEDKPEDGSRFHKFTGVTFNELVEKYPELYKAKTTKKIKKEMVEVEPEMVEPSEEEIVEVETVMMDEEQVQAEEEMALADEEITVHAVTVAEPVIEETTIDPDNDDDDVVVLRLTGYDDPARLSEDTFIRHNTQYYEIELPGMDKPVFLPAGIIQLNGVNYHLIEE